MNRHTLYSFRFHGAVPFALWSLAGRDVPLSRPAIKPACNDDWHPLSDTDTLC